MKLKDAPWKKISDKARQHIKKQGHYFADMEKEIATHSSILAWRIPWTEEPGGLQSMGLQRVGHNWNDFACTQFIYNVSVLGVQEWFSFLYICIYNLLFKILFLYRLLQDRSYSSLCCISPVQSLSRVWLFATRELQHARPPCPSPTPRIYPDSCPMSRWCHPTISSSVIPFSSCPQSFPASGSFQMSHFFTSGGQSIGVSASTSVLPMNIQDWFPLGWTGWISLQSKGLKSLLQHYGSKASILLCSACFIVQLSHPYMTTGKTIALTRQTLVDKVMSLLFNMLSRKWWDWMPWS